MAQLAGNNCVPKVAFKTLGCRSNYADTVEAQFAVLEQGAEIVEFSEEADVYVLNTCTVTSGADKDAQRILRQLRKKHHAAKIIVMGCLAEHGFHELEERKLVDVVIKKHDKNRLAEIIFSDNIQNTTQDHSSLIQIRNTSQAVSGINRPLSSLLKGPGEFTGAVQMRSRFHLRIQDGCENFCTYCIVPRVRGKFISRSIEMILEDVKLLSGLGYGEIVLTGTHIGTYGVDIGTSLEELLVKLEDFIPTLNTPPRIRLSSLDPNELSKNLIDFISKSSIMCNYLHVCFQSFSDKILKRMGRKYRLQEAIDAAHYAAKSINNCYIGSDLICGFPGESREDVEKAVNLFLDLPLSYLHVFPYSERQSTPAAKFEEIVPPKERKARADLWRKHAKQKWQNFLNSLLGSPLEIIVEQISNGQIRGTSREYASVRVNLENADKLSNALQLGKRLKVTPVGIKQDDADCWIEAVF